MILYLLYCETQRTNRIWHRGPVTTVIPYPAGGHTNLTIGKKIIFTSVLASDGSIREPGTICHSFFAESR